jgi:alpha-L-fucosidase
MKKITLLMFVAVAMLSCGNHSQPQKQTAVDHSWFEEARFGMFVHFGPYAVLSNGEWVMNNSGYSVEDYSKLLHIFDPSRFDAKKWVALAKQAGMKYITFTSRHHDSFSNWDTKQSDWNIMNTPYGKDLVRQLADECHKEGIKLVLYYSLLDWYRSDYSFTTGRTGKKTGRTVQGDWNDYIAFMKAQLTELLTNYGDIAGIWFDGEWDQMAVEREAKHLTHDSSWVDWHLPEIYDLIHRLQPNCMIANNHHLEALPGEDYQAFEKDLPGQNTGGGFSAHQKVSAQLPKETCETLNSSWGYRLRDNNYKSDTALVHLLVRAAGYGANLLLNVGPMATGEIDSISTERLLAMGKWLQKYGATIYGTKAGAVQPQSWGAITRKANVQYVHILNKESELLTIPFDGKIKSAKWLNASGKLQWSQDSQSNEAVFTLDAPMDAFDTIIEVAME